MPHPIPMDQFTVEAHARALRAAYARHLVASLFARLRRVPVRAAHA